MNQHDLECNDAELEHSVEQALNGIVMEDERSIVEAGLIYAVVVIDGVVRVMIDDEQCDLAAVMASELPDLITQTVSAVAGVKRVVVKPRPKSISKARPIAGVRHVLGIHSVKGGVGKSTVTALLALQLASQGKRVGIVDADVYGPSIPLLFGVSGDLEADEETGQIVPKQAHGIQMVSLALMLPSDEPLIWRGNLVDEGFPQLLHDVKWGELDVLLLDMPPGTGDVVLAAAQQAPLAGVVAVTSPSALSQIDVIRGIEFFADVQVPVLGLVENMAGLSCDCGKVISIFSKGGSQLAEKLGLPLLASLPFVPEVVQATEDGNLAAAFADGLSVAEAFDTFAEQVWAAMEQHQAQNHESQKDTTR